VVYFLFLFSFYRKVPSFGSPSLLLFPFSGLPSTTISKHSLPLAFSLPCFSLTSFSSDLCVSSISACLLKLNIDWSSTFFRFKEIIFFPSFLFLPIYSFLLTLLSPRDPLGTSQMVSDFEGYYISQRAMYIPPICPFELILFLFY